MNPNGLLESSWCSVVLGTAGLGGIQTAILASCSISLFGETRSLLSIKPHMQKSGFSTNLLRGGYMLYQNVHFENDSPEFFK